MKTYTVINGAGTIETTGIQSMYEAHQIAQRQADYYREPFFVSGPGMEPDADNDEDLGEQINPK